MSTESKTESRSREALMEAERYLRWPHLPPSSRITLLIADELVRLSKAQSSEITPRYTGADLVPTSWLDPLLTGPDKVLHGEPGTWGCPHVEALLNAIRERIQKADGITTVTKHLNERKKHG